MFQQGDLIVYGTDGVCRVEEIGTPRSPYIEKGKPYYFLKPLSRAGIIYAPVDSPVSMRPVVSRAAALELIDQIPLISESDLDGQSQTEMTQQYKALLNSHDCTGLLQLIKTAYQKKKTASSMGRKPAKLDTQAMNRAEDLLYDEFSVALGIPKDEVSTFIGQRVRELERTDSVNTH